MGTRDAAGVPAVTGSDHPPGDDEFEVTLLGPGYGESVVLHIGGGAWILVDSCGRADAPAALDYLRTIGLDPARVVELIVATHWHDDHIRGMARMVETCANAAFCCASALCREEFLTAVDALEGRHVAAFGSGVHEIHGTFSRLREAGSTPTWAGANRRLLSRGPCEIWSLAPADDAFVGFLRELGRLMPAAGQAETRIPSLSPNGVAVVLWITAGDIVVLLGSDLERGGWSTVVQDGARPVGRASVFKVPHHGSGSAHEPDVWEHMLEVEPLAVITPWKRGGRVVPNRLDKQRILAQTGNAYVSAAADSAARVRRDTMVERMVRQSGIRLRRASTSDGVRLRRRIGSGASWEIERFGSACHLRDFAV